MGLFDDLKADQDAERQRALEVYFALLSRIDYNTPSDADRRELADLMQRLRKSPAEAEKDRQAVEDAKRLVSWSREGDAAAVAAELAHAAHLTACAERQRVSQEQNAKVTAALMVQQDAEATRERAVKATGELRRLSRENAALHAAVTADDDDGKPASAKRKPK